MKFFTLPFLALTICCGCTNFDDRMKAEAEVLTKQHCPQKMDEHTTLDSATYDIDTRTYWRHCSLTPQAVQAVKENPVAIKKGLLDNLRNDVELKGCKDEGINFGYVYRETDTHSEILRIVFSRSDYESK